MATINETLLTAEEFLKLPAGEVSEYCELVEGKVVEMNVSAPRHGQICAELAFQLKLYSRAHNWGHDAGVRIVCVIVPEQQSVHIFRSTGQIAVLHDSDALTILELMPGLEIQLSDIFG